MEVQLTPDLQAKHDQLVSETGRSQQEFVLDAMAGYLDDLAPEREMLEKGVEAHTGKLLPSQIWQQR